MEKSKDLINWVALSRLLVDNESSISRNRIPQKYQKQVDELIQSIDDWMKKDVISVDE